MSLFHFIFHVFCSLVAAELASECGTDGCPASLPDKPTSALEIDVSESDDVGDFENCSGKHLLTQVLQSLKKLTEGQEKLEARLNQSVVTLTKGQEKLEASLNQSILTLTEAITAERYFGVRAVQQLQNCTILVQDTQNTMGTVMLVSIDKNVFLATAAHVADWLNTNQEPHLASWKQFQWCYHKSRDLALTRANNIAFGNYNPCPLEGVSFEVGEQVIVFSRAHDRTKAADAMLVGTVESNIPMTFDDIPNGYFSREGDIVIGAQVYGGWSGCSASNHHLLGVVIGSVPCTDSDTSRKCGAVVPAEVVAKFAKDILASQLVCP